MHVKSQILTLEWPHGSPEARSSGFETKARTLRYQALGRACLRQGIDALLVAHHQDDRAETVLDRLARGHKGSGLGPLYPQAQIAECRGLFGIYESGSFVRPDSANATATFGPEDGGLTIHRPLLQFPKSRLVATCQAVGLEWVEDQSNHDPMFTQRNAFRKLLREDLLPRALSRESLVNFSNTIQSYWGQRKLYANMIYEATHITFDLRSGVLTAQVPRLAQVFGDDWYAWSTKFKRRTAASYFRLLGHSAVSQESLRLGTLMNLPETIFASDFADHEEQTKYRKATDSATSREPKPVSVPKVARVVREAGGVMFQRNQAATSLHGEDRVWKISRAPCSSENMPIPMHFPPDQSTDVCVTEKHDIVDTLKLWDGRFWIKICNSGTRTVSVVMFREQQRRLLNENLPKQDRKRLGQLLNDAAPGKIRYTLPAIAILPDADTHPEEDIENAQIIALPTLGFVVEEWKGKITWDIRYKKLGLSGLRESIGEGVERSNYKLEKIARSEDKNRFS